jgi:hypothetical protein
MGLTNRRVLLRSCGFVLAFLLVSVGLRWQSQYFLPWIVRLAGLAGILFVIALPARDRWVQAIRSWLEVAERHADVSAGVLAAGSFAMTVAAAYFVHRPYPHISDGFAYLFQARIFAAGALSAAAPPVPESFQFEWLAVHDGRWFSIFPPGWPLLLAAGVKLGVPALVNPFLGALCVIVVYLLGKALFGPRHGVLCALFCCLSPFFLFMSSEFMSHTAALLFTSLSTLLHVRAIAMGSRLGGFALSGAAAGVAFLIRPLDALVIWMAQTAHALWTSRSRRMVAGACASTALLSCGMALYLLYNRLLVGAWLSPPLLLVSPRNRMGFGADIGYALAFPTPGHNPWRAFLNFNHNAAVMSQDLFGWPITSLLFILLLAMFGKKDVRHGLCGTIVAASIAGYALFWYHGEAYGARFYFTLLPCLLLLTVEGIRQTPEIVDRLLPGPPPLNRLARLSTAFVTLCFVFGWTVYVPKVSLVGPYYNHKGVNSGFDEFRRSQRLDNAIVFVRAPEPLYYGPALLANELPIGTGRVIYARDLGDDANAQLIALFPGRRIVRYTYERRGNPVKEWMETIARHAGVAK